MSLLNCGGFFGARRIQWAVIPLLAFVLLGCASRPGPEVLIPVAASPGVKTLQIYVATTRARETPAENVFTANRSSALNFAKFSVSIPPDHKSGNIELPTPPPDSQSSFAIVDQAVMSETDFRKAVASQGDIRRKKHKVVVFVHGFNNNFQESLFRIAQVHVDSNLDATPVLFAWPSQGQVAAYETDKESASYSRSYLAALLTMLSRSPEVSEVLVMAHSMGGMLMMETLGQLRREGKNQVIARLGRVVLAAPDIDAQTFRSQVEAIGPLKPPLLVLVSKDDGALGLSGIIGGGVRAGAINVDNPVVQEAALKAKVQVVDISKLTSHDDLGHDQFVSVSVLYARLHHEAGPYRNTPGTFVFADDGGTIIRPVDTATEAAAQ